MRAASMWGLVSLQGFNSLSPLCGLAAGRGDAELWPFREVFFNYTCDEVLCLLGHGAHL